MRLTLNIILVTVILLFIAIQIHIGYLLLQ